jgi:hypothetical protein
MGSYLTESTDLHYKYEPVGAVRFDGLCWMSESCGPRKYTPCVDADFICVWTRAFPQTLSENAETLSAVVPVPIAFSSSPVQGLLI